MGKHTGYRLEWCPRTANLTLSFVSLMTLMSSQQTGQQNFDTAMSYEVQPEHVLSICITSQEVKEDECEEGLA